MNTLYFWPEPLVPLREFHRVLAEGGKLVIAFSPRTTMEQLPVDRQVFTLYDPEQLEVLLAEAGFTGVKTVPGTGPHGDFVCAIAVKAG